MMNWLLFAIPFLTLSQTNQICGTWIEEKKKSHIEIYQNDEGFYEGKISWLAEPLNENGDIKKDKENPDKTLRDQPLKELIIIKNLQHIKNNEWGDGQIYDARSGKTYSLSATLKDFNTLFMRGYIGFSLIGRTTTSTRLDK